MTCPPTRMMTHHTELHARLAAAEARLAEAERLLRSGPYEPKWWASIVADYLSRSPPERGEAAR